MRKAIAAAVLLVACTAASAQPATFATKVDIALAPPAHAILVPGAAALRLPLLLSYEAQGAAPTTSPTRVELTVSGAPPWLLASFDPPRLDFAVPGCACVGQGSAQEAVLLLAATPDAPAGDLARLSVAATAPPNGAYQGSSDTDEATALASYVYRGNVTLDAGTIRLDERGSGQVAVLARHEANAPTRFDFELVDLPSGLMPTVPPPITSPPGSTATSAWAFQVAPGETTPGGPMTLRVTRQAALDPATRDVAGVLTIQVLPPSSASSDPSPATARPVPEAMGLSLLGLALAAVAVDRRRTR